MAKVSTSPWRLALTTGALLAATLIVYWIVYASSAVTDQTTKATTHGNPTALLVTSLLVVFLAGAGAVVLAKMLWDEIDLSMLISEANGDASMSRFQFLIFTFVIGGSYFLMVVWSLTATERGGSDLITDGVLNLPNIPPGVLGLIGISGGSYLVSKGIQKTAEASAASSVTGIAITTGGAGYSAATTVSFSGGGGTGATGTVTVTNGAVTDVKITAGGSGYTAAPTVIFADPGTPPGNGAAATAKIG